MLFEYLVVGSDGIEQKGRIEASTEDEAKKKLNDMGLSILSVSAFNEENKGDTVAGLKKFIFSGKDIENQEVEGEIDAKNEVFAYKRLVEEFNLEVYWVISPDLPKAVQEANKKTSVKKIEDLAYERGIQIKHSKRKTDSDLHQEAHYDDDHFKMQQREAVQKVDQLVKVAQVLLDCIQGKAPALHLELDKKVNNLQKIKMSNNLIYIHETSDEIIQELLNFFDHHKDEYQKNKKELLELESLLTHAATAKVQKVISDVTSVLHNAYNSFLSALHLRKKKEEDVDEHTKMLRKLYAEKSEILKLLALHAWGFITKVGELREKHKHAFKKLFKQYQNISKSIRKLKQMIQKIKDFESKDFTFFINEVEYFSFWLFGMYFVFFVFAEIALLKSKLLPINFVWQVIHSELIVSIVFGLFLLLFFTPMLKRFCSRNATRLFSSYVMIFLISLFFYYNY